jgi:hypothetical protein
MLTAYDVVTILAAAMTGYSAYGALTRAPWVCENLIKYGVPKSWLVPLGIVKAAGAVGLLAGLMVPTIGVAAALGLVAYFTAAVATVVRARYFSHIAYPVVFLLPPAASFALWLISRQIA